MKKKVLPRTRIVYNIIGIRVIFEGHERELRNGKEAGAVVPKIEAEFKLCHGGQSRGDVCSFCVLPQRARVSLDRSG